MFKEFSLEQGAQVSLSSGFHPQTNNQVGRANQELEAVLYCVASSNQSTWNAQLAWVEYAQNSNTLADTGISPFEESLSYQPPLLSIREGELAIPSVQHHMRCCHCVWQTTRAAYLRLVEQNKCLADVMFWPQPTKSPEILTFLQVHSTVDGYSKN